MKLAFCLFNYFPFGGLQMDCLRIAKECVRRGYRVDVYTMKWQGALDPSLSVKIISPKGWQNHTRSQNFVKQLKKELSSTPYDLVVGFNKMPELDVYYAADICYQTKSKEKHGWWYRLTSRYRCWVNFEKAVFGSKQSTKILLIARKQQKEFQQYYQTPSERFHLLPPGISKDRIAPPDADVIWQKVRYAWNIDRNHFLLLMVGSDFKRKGLDRIINGIAALPTDLKNRTHLFVIGQDRVEVFQHQAQQLGVTDQIQFLGGRHDVSEFLLAADLLVHPAYSENTGTVLLEALASGLPVLTTDVCGYAEYIEQAQAGVVIQTPFQQARFNQALMDMLLSSERASWRQNALAFTKTEDIYSMPEKAVDVLESLCHSQPPAYF